MPSNVKPVLILKLIVINVKETESMLQIVNVQLDSMKLTKKTVANVVSNVKLVLITLPTVKNVKP